MTWRASTYCSSSTTKARSTLGSRAIIAPSPASPQRQSISGHRLLFSSISSGEKSTAVTL
jgi:hypothetical protein